MEQSEQFKEEQLPLLENLKPYAGALKKFNTVESYINNYFDKKQPETKTHDNIIQCGPGRSRSFLDIYYLTKAKFSEVTLSEVAFRLLVLSCDTRDGKGGSTISSLYCGTVHKLVFYKTGYPTWSVLFKFEDGIFKKSSTASSSIPVDGITQTDIISLANEYINFLKQQQ